MILVTFIDVMDEDTTLVNLGILEGFDESWLEKGFYYENTWLRTWIKYVMRERQVISYIIF